MEGPRSTAVGVAPDLPAILGLAEAARRVPGGSHGAAVAACGMLEAEVLAWSSDFAVAGQGRSGFPTRAASSCGGIGDAVR